MLEGISAKGIFNESDELELQISDATAKLRAIDYCLENFGASCELDSRDNVILSKYINIYRSFEETMLANEWLKINDVLTNLKQRRRTGPFNEPLKNELGEIF